MRKLLAVCLLSGVCSPAASLEENREVIRKTVELLQKGNDNLSRFFFVRRRETSEFDADGKLKSKRSITTRRELYDGLVIGRLIARNDQPLGPDEASKHDGEIKASIAAYRARVAKEGPRPPSPKKKDNEDAQMMREFVEALDYKLAGTEPKFGRQANVYEFSPRPGYTPGKMKFRMFEKVRGKCWIDNSSNELILADAEVFDHISAGFGMLAKVGKGTRFHLQRKEAAPGLWVTEVENVRFDARVMLVKQFRQEIDTRYSEFQPRPSKD